jgi:hypothetical protein
MRGNDIIACVALAAPIVAAFALVTAVAVGERVGVAPLAGLVPTNSAEAAGMASAVHVARFLQSGADPNHVHPIRGEIISSSVLRATTLEAAMWSRQVELIRLLDRQGAISRADRHGLACLAADLEIDDIVEYLSPEGVADCAPGQALERVLARTSGARPVP